MKSQLRWGFVGPAGARRDQFHETVRRSESGASAPSVHPNITPLSQSDVDAIYLSVPFDERAILVERALEHGKPVLSEGPITADPAVANRIRDLSILNAVPVAETAEYQFHPQHEFVLELLRDGGIGEVREIHAQVSAPLLAGSDDDFDPERHDPWVAGNTVLGSLRSLVASEPVDAVGWCEDGSESDAESNFSGLLRFPRGITASLAWSVRPGYGAGYVVLGTEGTIEAPHAFLPVTSGYGCQRVVIQTDSSGRRRENYFDRFDTSVRMIDAFADALERPRQLPGGLDDIVANATTLNLVRAAVRRTAPTRQGGRQWNLSRLA